MEVTIVTGPKFKISLDNCKTNFYSSFNAIYSQLGKLNSIFVTLKPISTIAVTCLMYAIEAFPFSKSFMRALDSRTPLDSGFQQKIHYGTFD